MSEAPDASTPSSAGWDEGDWESLVAEIRHKQCTPFLGAGACAGVLPLGREMALAWADKYEYPFADRDNLARVAQYVAMEVGPRIPKFNVIDAFQNAAPPDFTKATEPHRVLADLCLPVYITTNYDNYMVQALQQLSPKRNPRREICKWYLAGRYQRLETEPDLDPTEEEPLVYHIHGITDKLESMVLTEDDLVGFLMHISEDHLVPPRIEQALTESSLLFMGYALDDLNFRVLLRKFESFMNSGQRVRHFSVQLGPRANESTADQLRRMERQRSYLDKHFGMQNVKIYWGSCEQFASELRRHWEAGGGQS